MLMVRDVDVIEAGEAFKELTELEYVEINGIG